MHIYTHAQEVHTITRVHMQSAPLEYAAQNAWLAEELEQSVLCADKVFVVTYHAWFADHPGEDDSQVAHSASTVARIICTYTTYIPILSKSKLYYKCCILACV